MKDMKDVSTCTFLIFINLKKNFLPSPSSSAYVHRIQQLSAHPNQLQTLISAASGNNEISVWDMETATRRQMIWASPVQPFGHMTENVSCV